MANCRLKILLVKQLAQLKLNLQLENLFLTYVIISSPSKVINPIEEKVSNEEKVKQISSKVYSLAKSLNPFVDKSLRIKFPKTFKCDFGGCKYQTKIRNRLNRHKQVHTQVKHFKCDLCPFETKHREYMKYHKSTHTDFKRFACDYDNCEFKTRLKIRLQCHIRSHHTFEKPYHCDHLGCDYKAATSNSLISHKRNHTGEKPFPCNYPDCGRKFKLRKQLNGHINRHKGLKPYSCDQPDCGQKFGARGHLKCSQKDPFK